MKIHSLSCASSVFLQCLEILPLGFNFFEHGEWALQCYYELLTSFSCLTPCPLPRILIKVQKNLYGEARISHLVGERRRKSVQKARTPLYQLKAGTVRTRQESEKRGDRVALSPGSALRGLAHERCSTSLIIEAVPIKPHEYHLTPVIMAITRKATNGSVTEEVEKGEPLCRADRECNRCSYYGKQYEVSQKN